MQTKLEKTLILVGLSITLICGYVGLFLYDHWGVWAVGLLTASICAYRLWRATKKSKHHF